jgi:beta-glucanase (GH16 family)
MRKFLTFLISLISLPFFTHSQVISPNYTLDWFDEFDFLDQSKWMIYNNASAGNSSVNAVYFSQNVAIDSLDGLSVLRIKLLASDTVLNGDESGFFGGPNPQAAGQMSWQSGRIECEPSYYEKYGVFEARIRFDVHYNNFPGFWLFTTVNEPQDSATEIDIMEYAPSVFSLQEVTNNFHVGEVNNHMESISLSGLNSAQWHKYSLEWTPSFTIWRIDNHIVRIEQFDYFVDPMRVLFNNAAHGSNVQGELNMYVDYFKYYKADYSCLPDFNLCDLMNMNSGVYSEIYLNENDCSLEQSDSFLYLNSSNGLRVQNEWLVPLGLEFEYLPLNCIE